MGAAGPANQGRTLPIVEPLDHRGGRFRVFAVLGAVGARSINKARCTVMCLITISGACCDNLSSHPPVAVNAILNFLHRLQGFRYATPYRARTRRWPGRQQKAEGYVYRRLCFV